MKIRIITYITLMLFASPNMLMAQTPTHYGDLQTTGWLKTIDGNLILNQQIINGNDSGYLLFCSDHQNHSGIGLYDINGKSYGHVLGTKSGSVGITDSLNRWTIRSQIDDFIEFNVADQEKMRINNSGSMLIGTQSNPGNHKLAVAGDMLVEKIKLGNDSETYGFLKGENNGNSFGLTDTAERWVIRSSNDFIEFSVAGQEKMQIKNDGNVLIGTQNPGNLTVAGDVLAEKIKLCNDTETYGFLKGENNGNSFGLTDAFRRWIIRSSMDDFIEFRVADDEKMRIRNDGSMLIGTQSNSGNHKLAVAGDMLAEEIKIGNDTTDKASIKYEYQDHAGNPDSSYWQLTLSASAGSSVTDDRIEFNIGGDEKMSIRNNGSVLIGTESNPGNYKLSVAGDMLAEEIKIGNDTTNKASIKYEYQDHTGISDSSYWYLSMNASSDPMANSFYLAENGLALIGINDPCFKTFTPGTYLYVGGEAVKSDGNGFWTYTSDLRLKTDIEPLHNSLEKLMDVNFYSYKHLDTDEFHYGVLAQEMQEIMPRSVGTYMDNTDNTEYLNFNPNDLFFTGLKAVQELGEEVEYQKEIINVLQAENAELRDELDAIKIALAAYGIELPDNDISDSGLEQNQPNPFSFSTIIPYTLPEFGGHAAISIYDMTGRILQKKILPNQPGQAQIEVDLSHLDANGTYFYSLHIGNKLIDTKQMILVK